MVHRTATHQQEKTKENSYEKVRHTASALSYAQAPVPFISLPLVPDATPPGGPEFTLTVNGTGFVSNSVVNWNGTALATQFVSGSQLTATVPAADIASAGTASVTVVSPTPGGGTSNTAFFSATYNTGSSVAFTLASSLVVPYAVWSVAVGDFNGDGRLDLAATSFSYPYIVSILLGDGTGNFTLASSLAGFDCPYSVAVGDFNGDGKLDLAVANACNGTVSILLGDGTGNFTLASSPATGQKGATALAVGDFNGDGKLDLAVLSFISATVSILLGDGTGNFALASSAAVGSEPMSVAVGDFNGDGKLDLAVANGCGNGNCQGPGTISILLGDGNGNFTLASSPTVGNWPYSVAVGDFNGDGKLDLAVPSETSATLSILLGDGTGNFTLASSPAVGGSDPVSVTVGDFNGDGKLDLAVANFSSNTVSILLGDGAGNFTLSSSPAAGYTPWAVALGDFNGDGKLDLAVTAYYGDTVSILLGIPTPPTVTLSPPSLNFVTQLYGTISNPEPVTLTTAGGGTLDITSISASNSNFFQTNDCGSSLAVGASCTISVIFRPHAVGTITGTITITDNASNSPQTVSLSGTSTVVTLSPSSLSFGNQPVGTTSQPQAVTFTNYAKHASLNIAGIRFTGSNLSSFAQTNTCGSSVPAGGSCTISVTFTPTHKGTKAATLEVFDNGGASPQTVALSGTGT